MRYFLAFSALVVIAIYVYNPSRTTLRASETLQSKSKQAVEARFTPTKLPLTRSSAITWIKLHSTKISPRNKETALEETIQDIRRSTRGLDGKSTAVSFYVSPISRRISDFEPDVRRAGANASR